LGVECNRPGQREESVEAFKRSLELNAGYLPSWINLGYVLCELGRATEAVDCLASALKLDPKSAEAHCNLGVAFLRLQKMKSAEAHFREATRINPGYLNAFFNLSRALAHQNRLSEAILIAERATEMSKESPSALADLGTLYVMGGAIGIGQALLTAAIQADPSLDDARAVLTSLRKSGESTSSAPQR
jgi:tetratricopeptide (TPR) repeat protein